MTGCSGYVLILRRTPDSNPNPNPRLILRRNPNFNPNPIIKAALTPKDADDGLFWMDWQGTFSS